METPRMEIEPIDVNVGQVSDWLNWKTRNNEFWRWSNGAHHQVWVNIRTNKGNVKVTQWNSTWLEVDVHQELRG